MTNRQSRRAARVAWAASAGVHGLLLTGLWLLPSRPQPAATDADHDLKLTLVEVDDTPEQEITVPFAPPPTSAPVAPEPTGRPPVAVPVPTALPASVVAFVREYADRPVVEAVQDVIQVQQTGPVVEPPSERWGSIPPSNPPSANVPNSVGFNPAPRQTIHGSLPAGRTVVYVLDCSGTMGLGGKLANARAALLATLASQSPGVRVMVVVYNGRATPLTDGGPTEVNDAVRERFANALAKLEPAGESRHAEGVRLALKFDPDYMLVLTDADDAELATVSPVVAGARRSVSASAIRVTAEGLESPRALR